MEPWEREYELERLNRVLNEIKSQLSQQENQTQQSWDKLQSVLGSYWEERFAGDEAQHLEAMGRERQLHAMTYSKKKKLARMVQNPYFGRVDFLEDESPENSPEKIYLGLGGLFDSEKGENLVYDWRAPISSLFYDYEVGPASYQCPAGLIEGKISLKRQYKIINGVLEYMFDCQLKIDDEILQEILSKNVDEKMRNIVASIQREQNRVIRDEGHKLLVVEGAAGSGKTSIALHRAAYLLYKDRNKITARNIMIFSPNRVFGDYISNVLPELGEENILQMVFQDLIRYTIPLPEGMKLEGWGEQLEYLLSSPDDHLYGTTISSIGFKSSGKFARLIIELAKYIENHLLNNFPGLIYKKHRIYSKEEWKTLWNKLSYLPPGKRLLQIRKRIYRQLRPLVKKLRLQKIDEIREKGEEINERTIKALARLAVWEELRDTRKQIDSLTTLDIFNYYYKLYQDSKLLAGLAEEIQLPDNWSGICAQTLKEFDQGYIPYEDIISLFYLQGYLEGLSVNNSILHLIIDEAQDYTPLQYEIIKQLFPRATWIVLGDLEQTVHPFFNVTNFAVLTNLFPAGEGMLLKLTKTYRSTSSIVDFCRTLLPGTQVIEHVYRPGDKPELIKVQDQENLLEKIIKKIVDYQKEGYHSIAIITKSAQDGMVVYQSLQEKIPINLVTQEERVFKQGIMVIPVYLAKGLEFDGVIIHDVSQEKYYREWERKVLYIACTRALHRLTLFYIGNLSPLLSSESVSLCNGE